MEYQVIIKNPFSRHQVLALLQGQGWSSGFPVLCADILSRPYVPGTASLSTNMLQRYRFSAGPDVICNNADFALYPLSCKGGAEKDYYLVDSRCLVYDRRIKWTYWESPLLPDGMDVTAAQIKAICPPASMVDIRKHVSYLNQTMRRYQINTRLRQVHFLAQLAHESIHFSTTLEGEDGKAYEGRKGLGNTLPGDGPRFKGRGLMQLTGRDAYMEYGKHIGLYLNTDDEIKLLEQEPYASDSAGWFWLKYKGYAKLNAKADKDDFLGITDVINGGTTGLANRKRWYVNAKKVFSL
jgi:predicted chitinase